MTSLQVELPAGVVRLVVIAPAAVLSAPCEQVDPTDAEVVQLAADLLATMDVSPGCVGLAANQVGVPWRASRNEKAREGCMSVPDFTGDVKRATRLVVTGQLPGSGESVTLTTDAFEARAVQHEVDHLDGLLFIDRVVSAAAIHKRKVYLD